MLFMPSEFSLVQSVTASPLTIPHRRMKLSRSSLCSWLAPAASASSGVRSSAQYPNDRLTTQPGLVQSASHRMRQRSVLPATGDHAESRTGKSCVHKQSVRKFHNYSAKKSGEGGGRRMRVSSIHICIRKSSYLWRKLLRPYLLLRLRLRLRERGKVAARRVWLSFRCTPQPLPTRQPAPKLASAPWQMTSLKAA